ncbi:hypothetical protein ANME2D_01454 [Candidatus Methanoperedens nitroreducens]|uniref:Uncharacterized protein n=1 Tax=Candidatus Methanoperedens nitratireducens TaxID=1392998 RepID=A0A062V655_9EURY|nr:hypothetical protein [Candidatus Methanoperedens nitroreducens]KCZ72053.1 hypothetical protein ANME2D_01454 [Candidatus Methanoperedens nitroreducens]MDJ1421972.1 hypothetical protein [Candidatus Methanoperedens sp.]
MKKILTTLAIILLLIVPAVADINQNARLRGENMVLVSVNQEAWNYGSGNINQDIGIHVTGNHQIIDQDSRLVLMNSSLVLDPDYAVDINNTMKGLNRIVIDLDQYGNNSGSGSIAQGIEVLVDDNVQILDQEIIVLIG